MEEKKVYKKKDNFEEPLFQGDGSGNIWGWKFSYISLAIILIFLALYIYRVATTGNSLPGFTAPTEQPAQ
jgi:hypothetical protein